MLKYLKIFISLLSLTILLTVSSCSKKRSVTDYENKGLENTPDSNNPNNSDADENQNNDEILDNQINYFKLPKKKEITFLDKNFIKSNDTSNFVPLDSINNIYIVNTVPIDNTVLEYYKSYFNNLNLVGFSIFYVNKQLNPKNIKYVAQKYGANIVIYKSIYVSKNNNYIVEILYLNGDLTDSTLYFNRENTEAIPVQDSLNELENNKKTEVKKYSLRSVLGINSEESEDAKKESNSLLNENVNVNSIQDKSDNVEDASNLDENNENKINKNLDLDSEIRKLEKRINNVVGLWMDSNDKSIVSIQEIPKNTMKRYNNNTYIDSSVIKYYGAYIILKDERSIDKYNKERTVNTDELFKWKDGDLKFQFNSSGKSGVYLNKNKMPEIAFISIFPIKGILMITMTSGETRYYIPLGLDMNPKFIKNLYKNLPSYIKPMNSKDTAASHYGTGLYGWIVSGGIILMGLGLLSMF